MVRINRNGDGRDIADRAFHGGGNRSRIGEVVRDVGTGIDAADDERRFFLQQTQHDERNTIGRRAVRRVRR